MRKIYSLLFVILFATLAQSQTIGIPESANNETFTNAMLITSPAKIRGSVFPNGDLDWFKFTATTGDKVYAAVMTSFSASASTDAELRLYASDGTTVIEFDQDDGVLGGLSSTIAGATIPSPGTYYLQVKHFSATNTLRPYYLYLKVQTGAPTPEVESNDTQGTANVMPASGWVSGSRDPAVATEQDWFSVTLLAGESVFISMDLDPERDNVQWNGRLGFALFGDANNQILVVDDASAGSVTNPLSEAFFFTAKDAGTYYVFADAATAATGGPTATYNISFTKFAATAATSTYDSYVSTNVPQTIADGVATTSTITVPANTKRLKDIIIRINLTHTLMADIDAELTTPEGNTIALFNDIGSSATGGQTQMDLSLSDNNAVPFAFTIVKGVGVQPELNYPLSHLKGMLTPGVWTLRLRDDLVNTQTGTLNGWSMEFLEDVQPNLTGAVTVVNENFEANNGGFTLGTIGQLANEWEYGTPATPGTTTTNPVAAFTTANSGVNCWKTDLDNTYDISSNQDLLSPVYNIPAGPGIVWLSWAMKFQMESATFDKITIRVFEDGNPTNSQILYQWMGATMTAGVGTPTTNVAISTPWGVYWVDISAFAGKNIRFEINVNSDTSITFGGVAFDDLKIYFVSSCTPSSITLGASPAICSGTTSTNLPYTATTGTPDQYSIDYDAAAEAQGFVDVVNAALPATPITLTVPGAAVAATYNGSITVRLAAGGCVSPAVPFTVAISTPALFAVTGGGGYCTGGSGLTVGLSGSETGVNYQLYVGASPVGAAVAGTGTAINFGLQTTAGTYTVVATNATTTCTNNMTGSATVTINPLPIVYNVTGGGSYCAGGTGVSVGIDGSEAGVNYQLYVGASPVGAAVAGTGSALNFGLQTAAGSYTVVGTNAVTTCTNNMTGSAAVSINPVPVIGSSLIQPTTCVSTDGAIDITMSGAAGPYTYTWSTLDGSGIVPGAEDQTALTVGQYTLVVSAANTCTATATFNLPGPGGCSVCPTIGALTTNPTSPVCFNSTVTLTASGLVSMGVTYGIEFKVSPIPLADPYTGGSTIATVPNAGLTGGGTTATTTTTASGIGSYYLYAILSPAPIDPACRPSALLNVTVNPNPVISIAPAGPVTICAGSNTTLTASGICTDYIFSGVLSGTQEVPPNASTATGFFSGSYNTVSNQLTLNLTFSGMTANVSAGHIHNAGPGVNGPVIIPFTGLPTGVTSGTYSNTFTVPLANVAALLAGNTYINIHTVAFPGGEIRSQLVMNPCSPITSYLWSTTETTPSISVSAANTYTVTATDANGCAGTASVVVNVNPIPTVNAVASQVLCNGTATTAVAFSGAVPGTVYNWTNDDASIGLAASGSGDIASFTATNITNAPIVATITVTPSYTNGGTTCNGTPITFTITVNPTPNVVATPASQTICSGATITTIVLTGAISGTTFNWTRNNTAVTGIAASGSGDISGALTNLSGDPVMVTFTITPTANGCPGTPVTATVVVNPIPNAAATPASQTICSAGSITTIVLAGYGSAIVSGTTFNWTRDNTVSVTGIAASGSGNISGSLTNTTTAPVTVTFTITPIANGCPGTPITATVLVNPTPNAVATPASQTVCTNTAITAIVLSGNVSGTTYSWTRNNTVSVTGLAASGSGNISGTLVNTTTVQQTVTFTITPTANGCPGAPITATVIVNPTPTIVCPANIVVSSTPGVCGAAVTYPPATATGTPAPTITYSIASGSVFPVGLTTVTATATNACGSVSCTFTVRVNDVQPPVITCPSNITVNTTAGACTAIVSYIVTATDNCPGVATVQLSGLPSGAAFPLGVTTVTHRATDASGNAVTCSFTVTVNDAQVPAISAQPANRTVCTGTNATFSVTATNAVTYQWQSWNGSVWSNITGATGATLTLNNVTSSLGASSYRVLVNGLCTVVTSNQATLYVNPLPTVSIAATPLSALLPGQTTSITATTNPSGGSFAWFKNGAAVPGSGAVYGPITIDDIGTYRTVYTDPNGCVSTSANVVITGQASDNMWVYPNPNIGQFNVRYYNQTGETATLKVYDYLGHEVYSQILPQGITYSNTVVSIPKAAAEVYIVKVVTSTGRELAAKRIVVYH